MTKNLCILLWATCALSSILATPCSAAEGLRAGGAAVDLAADDSMVIAGGIEGGRAVGQEGKLRAVAVVVEQPPLGKLAIVACDVLFVRGDMVERAKREIQQRTGIPPERVLVNATHTHSAPSTVRVHGYAADEKFVETVTSGIIESVVAADKNLAGDCTFSFALGEEATVGANSRLLLSDGTIFWIGSKDDAVRPTGPFDPQLPVLAFSKGDQLRALVFNHSTHTIGTVRPGVRSPCFYGLAAQELEAELGATVCFLEGASGSTHNIGGIPADEAVRRMKAAVLDALGKAEPRPVSRLETVMRPFEFKVRTYDEATEEAKVVTYCDKRAPQHSQAIANVFRQMRKELAPHQGEARTTWLQVCLIGDVAIVGVPAEFFTKLGVDIKKRSPFPRTYVAELANDWIGYVGDREAYDLGGYQTWMGHHSYVEPGTGERIVDQVVAMLDELAAKK